MASHPLQVCDVHKAGAGTHISPGVRVWILLPMWAICVHIQMFFLTHRNYIVKTANQFDQTVNNKEPGTNKN